MKLGSHVLASRHAHVKGILPSVLWILVVSPSGDHHGRMLDLEFLFGSLALQDLLLVIQAQELLFSQRNVFVSSQ
jgi:hypothetical protein